ncbi:MAG: hypothetical protein E3K32_08975 [wastewater metagenome]|nr:hypothetical protein [Candidatus Loosdrechtia aerotolerans]
MKSLRLKISLILLGLFVCFFNIGCPCEEHLNLYVFVGHLTPDECRRAIQEGREDTGQVRFLCKGEEVTICWHTSGANIQLDPGFGMQDASGLVYLTVESDTTVKATPLTGCAGSKEVKIKVVTEPTPSTWIGKWNRECSAIEFEIHEQFVSTNIKAIDITAQWEPTVVLPDGSTLTCTTPPFLDGFHQEEVFGFQIRSPFITETFTRRLKAVGHWAFVLKADCGVDFQCNPTASFEFNITLVCD